MKKIYVIILAAIIFSACSNTEPIVMPSQMYVVNTTDYKAGIYFDNQCLGYVEAYSNTNVDISGFYENPIYVQSIFFDSKNNKIGSYSWTYTFSRQHQYKMTLTKSAETTRIQIMRHQ